MFIANLTMLINYYYFIVYLRDTTHVVFKDGLLSSYKKAKQMNIPIVSILWIEACKNELRLCDPKDYPISNLDFYENPEIYGRVKVSVAACFHLNPSIIESSFFLIVDYIQARERDLLKKYSNRKKYGKILDDIDFFLSYHLHFYFYLKHNFIYSLKHEKIKLTFILISKFKL